MKEAKRYNAEIDVVKFLCAMMIVFFHFTHFTKVYLSWPGTTTALICLPGGYIATDFFFMLSGLMMAGHVYRRRSKPIAPGETLGYCFHKYGGVFSVMAVSLVGSLVLGRIFLAKDLLMLSGHPWDALWEGLSLHMTGIGNPHLINDPDWYLSALLLGCFALYPLLRRYPDAMTLYVAPIGSLLIFGYLVKTYGHLCVNFGTFTLVYPALLRAIGGLLLGCFAYQAGERLRALRLTQLGRWCVTMGQAGCFAAVWLLSTASSFTRDDMVSLLFLFLLTSLLASGQSALLPHLPQRFSHFLGNMSKALFFSHYIILRIFRAYKVPTNNWRFLLYTVCALAFALVVLGLSMLCNALLHRAAPAVRRLMVRQDERAGSAENEQQ